MENLLNVNQAAFILKVHPLTVRRYLREGKLHGVKVGGNVRIKESQLQEFNKDFTPNARTEKSPFKRILPTKTFTNDDPFLRLKGRGASLNLTTIK